jgi:hypothetical protein
MDPLGTPAHQGRNTFVVKQSVLSSWVSYATKGGNALMYLINLICTGANPTTSVFTTTTPALK